MKFKRFFTSSVTYISFAGILLIIMGQADFLHYLMPIVFPENSFFNPVIKSIGAALIGSGVFTAIIRSNEYTQIFSEVIGQIIWSKKYIEKRTDKKAIWSMVSKLMYDEKFPLISEELEEIITAEYFPISHKCYIENSNILINISDHSEHFWHQSEVVSMTVKPIKNAKINYIVGTAIDLPDDTSIDDQTTYKITSVKVNEAEIDIGEVVPRRESNLLKHKIELLLADADEYKIVVNREKVVCKKTNPDKRTFARYIIKGAKVTIICPAGMNVAFHKMGTVKEFKEEQNQINGPVKVVSWSYDGVILPHQGYIVLLK